MSNAAKNEVLSSFRETINNSLAEMDHRKLKHLFTPFFHFLACVAGVNREGEEEQECGRRGTGD